MFMFRAMLAICPVGVTYQSIDITDQLVDSGGEQGAGPGPGQVVCHSLCFTVSEEINMQL